MKQNVKWRSSLVAATVLAVMAAGATPAFASSEADPEAVADAVEAVAPTDLSSLDLKTSGDQLNAQFPGGGTATVNVDASEGVTFVPDSADAQATTVALPGTAGLSDAVVSDDGSVTYPGDSQTPSVNVVVGEDAVRISTVIASATQTEEFDYDFGVGATVEIQDDGSALVLADAESTDVGNVETILATVNVPWAADANGAPVQTHYVANGSILTQVVTHQGQNVTYPVVADPSFDQPNIFQSRVRFNRAETASIAAGGWGGVVGSFSCGVMAPVCVLASGVLAYQAGVAQNSSPKRCVQVTATNTYTPVNIVWWVDTYSGGPCR